MASDMSTSISIQVSQGTQKPVVSQEAKAPVQTEQRQVIATTGSTIGRGMPASEEKSQVEETQQDVDQIVSRMNDFVQNIQRDLQFSVDEISGRTVIRVLDSQSNEVVRQFPSEDVLAVMRFFAEITMEVNSKSENTGILFEDQV